MRIGIFTDTYLPNINGVTTSIVTVESELRKLGHEVLTFAPNDKLKYEVFPEQNLWRLPSIRFYGDKTNRFVVRFGFSEDFGNPALDVVHIQTPFPVGRAGLRFAKKRKLRTIHTYHTRYQEYAHYLGFPNFIMNHGGQKIAVAIILYLAKKFVNKHDAVIAPSLRIKKELESFGVKRPIAVIPTGIDINKVLLSGNAYDPDTLLRKLNINLENELIVFTSRLAREKNIEFLIKAFKKVSDSRPTVTFLIIGDGDHRRKLQSLVKELDLDGRIIFSGFMKHDEIFSIYRKAKVFVFSSLSETQGLVVLEAMALGLPVVALEATGVEDLLIGDRGGLMIREQNLDLFANAIIKLLTNKELHKLKSDDAANRAKDFSVEKTIQMLLDVYQNRRTDIFI